MKDVSKEEFFQSRLLLDAMSFNFAILGEAANKVSDALQAKHPEIPWGDIIGMRNILIHDYVRPRPEYMWDAYRNDLAPLKQHLQEILKEPGWGVDTGTTDCHYAASTVNMPLSPSICFGVKVIPPTVMAAGMITVRPLIRTVLQKTCGRALNCSLPPH